MDENYQESEGELIIESSVTKKKVTLLGYLLIFLVGGAVVLIAAYFYILNLNNPPNEFPLNQPVTIETGTSVQGISSILADHKVVKSDILLYYTLVLFYDPANIKASTYVFESPLTTLEVAKRLSEGDFDTNLVKFTHFEGERATKLAERATETLPQFNADGFLATSTKLEGKLFPDTYFIPADYDDEQLLNLLLNTFEQRVSVYSDDIAKHPLTLDEILVLASIIEREANSVESMKMVSSVLQNRLEINMALQADASLEYILDKPLSELTPKDLEIDSPYNTYLYPGLPPTPIGNPGIDSIEAVLYPAHSEYFYYITGEDGEFYYAESYQEHLNNINRYLK